jgi:hypothetical protein
MARYSLVEPPRADSTALSILLAPYTQKEKSAQRRSRAFERGVRHTSIVKETGIPVARHQRYRLVTGCSRSGC